MKKTAKTSDVTHSDNQDYLFEVASKYHEQLEYLNARKDKIKRISITYAMVFGILVIASIYVTDNLNLEFANKILPVTLTMYGVMLFALYYLQYSSVQSKINQTLNRMRLEEKLQGTYGDSGIIRSDNEEYFSKLVQINIENLSAYYEQVKVHANKSFIASLIMSIVGFMIIASGLIMGFNSSEQQTLLIFVSTGSGIIIEAIAALFFYLYTQTVHQMKGYHDGLLYVQNILLSLKLIEGIDGVDANLKAESINKLVEYLLAQRPVENK